MATRETMTIGQLAKAAGVGVETIRYYERKGLLPAPPRRRSGYRQYDAAALSRMRFILRGKQLGFTLAEIRELLALRRATGPCAEVHARALAKIEGVEARLRDLERIRDALQALARDCERGGPQGPCPIIEALDAGAAKVEPG